MKHPTWLSIPALSVFAFAVLLSAAGRGESRPYGEDRGEQALTRPDRKIERDARQAVIQGRQIFRVDTFGDEAFWGDTIKLHQAIQGARFGGVGPGSVPGLRWRSA